MKSTGFKFQKTLILSLLLLSLLGNTCYQNSYVSIWHPHPYDASCRFSIFAEDTTFKGIILEDIVEAYTEAAIHPYSQISDRCVIRTYEPTSDFYLRAEESNCESDFYDKSYFPLSRSLEKAFEDHHNGFIEIFFWVRENKVDTLFYKFIPMSDFFDTKQNHGRVNTYR